MQRALWGGAWAHNTSRCAQWGATLGGKHHPIPFSLSSVARSWGAWGMSNGLGPLLPWMASGAPGPDRE